MKISTMKNLRMRSHRMTKDLSEIRKNIREQLRLDFIIPDDIPDIELYMDQVTKFMDERLETMKRRDWSDFHRGEN